LAEIDVFGFAHRMLAEEIVMYRLYTLDRLSIALATVAYHPHSLRIRTKLYASNARLLAFLVVDAINQAVRQLHEAMTKQLGQRPMVSSRA
jgi:hypothetical protein